MPDQRRRKLLIEFELPTFYADDLPELLAEFGERDEPMGEQILQDIDLNFAAMTLQTADGDVITVAALPRDARVVDEAPDPDDHAESVKRLVDAATERQIEATYEKGYDEGLRDGRAEAATPEGGEDRG